MIKIDLITGFLGSGKTTFIKMYARFLMSQGLRVGILSNDYGAVNVDTMLLKELRGDNCELESVAGGCDSDCHSRRFKTKLIAMAMSGYDRVIIEPSGVFDVDEFFDTIHDEPLDRWYEEGSVITIVDSMLEDNMSSESDYYLASQAACAGVILMSRSQLASASQIDDSINHLLRAAEGVKLRRDLSPIINRSNWFNFTDDDFRAIMNSGHRSSSYVKLMNRDIAGFETMYFLDKPMGIDTFQDKLNTLFGDSRYGEAFRVKGFVLEDGAWKQINATPRATQVADIDEGQQVFIVIGRDLNKEAITQLFEDL